MAYFLENLSLLSFVLLTLVSIGLGVVLWISPRKSSGLELILAPLVGLILIGSLSLVRLSVLLIRLRPAVDTSVLLLISALLCFTHRKKLLEKTKLLSGSYKVLLIIPLLFMMLFAILFSREGIILLSAGEDELQYAASANQMIYHMHTGTEMDMPAPRIDHWIYDLSTRDQPYSRDYRKGGEISLATFSVWLGQNTLQTFPIAAGIGFLLLLIILGFIGKECLNLGFYGTIILQFSFMVCFHFSILHLQGSLANLCSCPMILGTLSLFGLGLSSNERRWLFLSGILLGGVFLFYSEIAIIAAVLPIFLMLITTVIKDPIMSKDRLAGLSGFIFTTLLVAHKSIFAVISYTRGNLEVVFANFQSSNTHNISVFERLRHLRVSNWTGINPLLGLTSYYDQSSANDKIATFLSRPGAVFWIGALLSIFAILGFAIHGRSRSKADVRAQLSRAFGFVFAAFIGLATVSLMNEDYFRFMRSTGYSIPFMFIGLLLLATPVETYVGKFRQKLILLLGAVAFISIFSFNFWTTSRTFSFVYAHNASDDPIIRRLSPTAPAWTSLREELRPSTNTPILISSFDNTPIPHLIISGIQPYPTFLGETIYRFWKVMNLDTHAPNNAYFNPSPPSDQATEDMLKSAYATVFSSKEMGKIWNKRTPYWANIIRDFIENSRQAIVPPGSAFPPEWDKWHDIFSEKRTQFKNVCDVLYKTEKSIGLESNGIGSLQKDKNGLYRTLKGSGRLNVNDWRSNCFRLKVVYDGNPEDLIVRKANGSEVPSKRTSKNMSESTGIISYSDALNLTLIPHFSSVNLREVAWSPSVCNRI